VGGRRYDLLLPGIDASLLAASRWRERLEPFVELGLPPPEHVERSLSKVALLDYAAEPGIPAPEPVVCTEPEIALTAANELGYPVLKSGQAVFEQNGRLQRLAARWFMTRPRSSGCCRSTGRYG
jgi:predicted ATP-grasp superfamily ATP-dependent carboligase